MIGLMIKIGLIYGIVTFYQKTEEKVTAALIWAGSIFVLGLAFQGMNLMMLLGVVASSLIVLGAFTLYEHFEQSLSTQIFVGAFAIVLVFLVA